MDGECTVAAITLFVLNGGAAGGKEIVAKEEASVPTQNRTIVAIDKLAANVNGECHPCDNLVEGTNASDAVHGRRERLDAADGARAALLHVEERALAKQVGA